MSILSIHLYQLFFVFERPQSELEVTAAIGALKNAPKNRRKWEYINLSQRE